MEQKPKSASSASEFENELKNGGKPCNGNGYEIQNALGYNAFKNPFQDYPEHIKEYPYLCRYLEAFSRSRAERHCNGGIESPIEMLLKLFIDERDSIEKHFEEVISMRQKYHICSELNGLFIGTSKKDGTLLVLMHKEPQEWKWTKEGHLLHVNSGLILGTRGKATKGAYVSLIDPKELEKNGIKWKIPWKSKSGSITTDEDGEELVLDVDQNDSSEGASLVLWTKKFFKSANQHWSLVPSDDFEIKSNR